MGTTSRAVNRDKVFVASSKDRTTEVRQLRRQQRVMDMKPVFREVRTVKSVALAFFRAVTRSADSILRFLRGDRTAVDLTRSEIGWVPDFAAPYLHRRAERNRRFTESFARSFLGMPYAGQYKPTTDRYVKHPGHRHAAKRRQRFDAQVKALAKTIVSAYAY